MHFTLVLSGLLALLVTTTTAQEVTDLCTVSPPRCTIGATACPSGCFKSDRCTRPCPSKTTTVVTYTSRTTVRSITTSTSTTTTTRTRTRTRTTTVTATPSAAPPATCAAQVPYINVFTFVERSCAVLVDAERDLLCLFDDAPQVNFTFAGPPNKLNTPTWRTLPSGTQYPTSECVELAVPGSRSAYFTVDGTDGTNALSADCLVVLYVGSGCTGVADAYNINKANTCLSIPETDDPWTSARFECSFKLGPA